jgi:hypothetical protein
VNSFFISAPVDCGGPNYRRRILRSMGRASQTWRGDVDGCLDITKARAKRPRERR